jgi:hypothetical protein
MFSPEPSLPLKIEVQKYIRSCEYVLSLIAHNDPPLSDEEKRLIEFYREELGKALRD